MGRLPIAAFVAGATVMAACATDDGVGTSSTATTAEPEASGRPTGAFPSGGDGEPFALENVSSHFTGEGIIGRFTGRELDVFPLATVAWSTFRDAEPDGVVLSRDTGFSRDYGRNPYPGYDDVDGVPFLFQGEVDGRYTALTRMVGVEHDGAAVGIPLQHLREQEVVSAAVGGRPLVAFWAAGTSSALESASIAEGVDVGATGVFVPEVDGAPSTFVAAGDGFFTDAETGSSWNVLGEAVAGELAGERLDAYVHVDTFWFAWSTFRPDTEIVAG